MERDALINYVTGHGATLKERRPRSDLYVKSGPDVASIPLRPHIDENIVISVCRTLDIPVPLDLQKRRRRNGTIKKPSELVIRVTHDEVVLVIPRGAGRRGKLSGAGRGRKRSSRE